MANDFTAYNPFNQMYNQRVLPESEYQRLLNTISNLEAESKTRLAVIKEYQEATGTYSHYGYKQIKEGNVKQIAEQKQRILDLEERNRNQGLTIANYQKSIDGSQANFQNLQQQIKERDAIIAKQAGMLVGNAQFNVAYSVDRLQALINECENKRKQIIELQVLIRVLSANLNDKYIEVERLRNNIRSYPSIAGNTNLAITLKSLGEIRLEDELEDLKKQLANAKSKIATYEKTISDRDLEIANLEKILQQTASARSDLLNKISRVVSLCYGHTGCQCNKDIVLRDIRQAVESK